MRIHTNPVDPAYVYPCSKRDVREAFGHDLLESAWFGLLPDFRFDHRATHRPTIMGIVPIKVTVSRDNEATLYVYRIRQEVGSTLFRSRLREMVRGEMRAWIERKVVRTETEILSGYESLLVELRDGLLLTHEIRYL